MAPVPSAPKAKLAKKPLALTLPPEPGGGSAAYDRMEETTASVTIYWDYQKTGFAKQLNFGWIEYAYYFLQSPNALRILFMGGSIEVRCEIVQSANLPLGAFPLGDMLKDFRERRVCGVYDQKQRGFHVSVYRMVRGPEGKMCEEEL